MHSVLNSTQVYTQPKLTVKINGSSGLLFEYSHRRGSYLSGCPPKSGPASLGSPVNLPFIFCGRKGLNEERLKSS